MITLLPLLRGRSDMAKASRSELACLLTVTLAAALSANTALAAIPGPYEIHRMPECDIAAQGQICRITVPNGDFEGLDDSFWHGEFQWFGFNKERHSMAEHLTPWSFEGPRALAYMRAPALYNTAQNLYRTVRLVETGDRISQWVDLPVADSDDFIYTVHAHAGAENGEATVAIAAAFDNGERQQDALRASLPVQGQLLAGGQPVGELVESAFVPAGSNVRRIGLRIEKIDGAASIKVDDVVVVRSYPGQLPLNVELPPSGWID